MVAELNISGERYGLLVSIHKVGVKVFPAGQRRSIWRFRCDCGNEVDKTLMDVRRGDTKSCGCVKRKNIPTNTLPVGEASFNGLFVHYKRSAKSRGYEWCIEKEFFRKITKQPCHYCGSDPFGRHLTHASANGHYVFSGLDRVNNKVGYVESNVVPCCSICNRAKAALDAAVFLEWAKKVALHNSGNKNG